MDVASKIVSAAAILIAVAGPARAATIQYGISGTVLGGYDLTGVFGGGDLTGKSFSAIETFNTSNAASSYANAGGSGANGGLKANGLSFITVGLTLGGVRRTFSDDTSNVSVSAGGQFTSNVQSSSGPGNNNIGFNIASAGIAADYTRQGDLFGLSDRYAGYYTLSDARAQQVVWANFEVNSFTTVSSVPLPSAAPMFGAALLSMGAIGFGWKRTKAAHA